MNDIFDGSVCQRYGDWRAKWNTGEIINAWKRVGVQVFYNDDDYGNSGSEDYPGYTLNGIAVPAKQAFQHAMNVTGKHLAEYSWCW